MTNVVNINSKQQIAEQAGVWLARLERGLSEPERLEVDSWLAENSAHGEALMELASIWDDMGMLEELSDLFPLDSKELQPDKELQPAKTHQSEKEPQLEKEGWSKPGWLNWDAPKPLLYAYSGILVAFISVLFLWQSDVTGNLLNKRLYVSQIFDSGSAVESHSPENSTATVTALYETAIGEQSTVNLPDGSKVTLNTGTRIQVQYTPSERGIVLQTGEGYFEVAKDADRPFRVHVDKNVVQAIGTAFNVDYSRFANLEVTVTEGTVKLVSPPKIKQILSGSLKEESILKSGQHAVLANTEDHNLQPISESEITKKLAWKSGMIIFERESLRDALAELSRYTLVEFVLADPAMENMLVGGYFKSGDIDGLLQALEENFNITSFKNGTGQIVLTAQL